MTWKVRIVGDLNDLAELQKSLTAESLKIESTENGEYYLLSNAFQKCTDENEVSEAASSKISLLSGATRLALGGNRPIEQAHVVKENEDGTKTEYMQIHESVQIRDSLTVSVIDSKGNLVREIKPADEVPRWVEAGMGCDAVAKVFRLYTRPLDWVGLYRIYEVIEHDMKGIDKIVSKGWATKSEIRRFKHTSNSPGATGDDARHGKESSQAPKEPMPLHEARNLIERLSGLWLKTWIQPITAAPLIHSAPEYSPQNTSAGVR